MADSIYPTISLMPPAKGAPVKPPNVEHRLPESESMLAKWQMIADCIAGQEAIKKAGVKYLPAPNPEDKSPANVLRYEDYVTRALFFNVVANTLSGLVGQVFNTDPVSEYPPELEPLWYDADGRGVTLIQQAKKALSTTLAAGFCGILVDYPVGLVDEAGKPIPFSRQDVNDGLARPTLQYYGPVDIVNWRLESKGAVSKLSLLVLMEDYIIRDDGFEIQRGREYRVLRLVDGKYQVELWRRTDEKQEGPFSMAGPPSIPTDANGQPFTSIPFFFIGAQNNDSQIDKPPMYDLACINIAHYRNSADYEDSVYMVGQPTPYFAGLTQSWVDNVLKEKIQLGSRGAVPLPAGGTAGMIQAAPNTMVKEAMESKERQMVSIGAQLVEDKQVQTLGEAKMENAVVLSTLSSCSRNVSQAFENALIAAAMFAVGTVDKAKLIFKLSTDFAIAKMSPEERKTLLTEWQGGILSFSEAREQLRQSGIATLDDDDAKEEIAMDQEAAIDLAAKEIEATGGPEDKPDEVAEE